MIEKHTENGFDDLPYPFIFEENYIVIDGKVCRTQLVGDGALYGHIGVYIPDEVGTEQLHLYDLIEEKFLN